MKSLCLLVLLAGALLAPLFSAAEEPASVEERVTQTLKSDVEMNAARQKARDNIEEFKRRLLNPPATQSYISLKATFSDGEFTEHMWMEDVVPTPGGFRGTVSNAAVDLERPKLGEVVEIKLADVSDWYAIDDGYVVGGYTLRLIRDRKPESERARYDEMVGARFR